MAVAAENVTLRDLRTSSWLSPRPDRVMQFLCRISVVELEPLSDPALNADLAIEERGASFAHPLAAVHSHGFRVLKRHRKPAWLGQTALCKDCPDPNSSNKIT